MWFSKEEVLFDSLSRPLENDNVHESLWNNKCDYVNIEKCKNLNPENLNLIAL